MTNGHGTLRRNGGVTELRMLGATACAVQEQGTALVRMVMIEKLPGGCKMELKLTAEDAARFASTIYELARTAIIRNERDAASTHETPASTHDAPAKYQAVAA